MERFCDRLPELIPVMPAVLTHGDLWAGNLLSRDDRRITLSTCRLLDLGRSRPVHAVGLPASAAVTAVLDLYQELNPSLPG